MFHPRSGSCVALSNGNKTASRTNPTQEFNKGLIFSFEPIKDNELFEVKIDKKLNTWSGSIEIGVTVCNPDVIEIPITATDLKGGTWIMLGQGVFRDGLSLLEAYGCDLDKLVEGDKVGVMRTSQGELKFFVNGESQGVASTSLPPMVYAVVDMYGKCAQISITTPTTPDSLNALEEDSTEDVSVKDSNLLEEEHVPNNEEQHSVTESLWVPNGYSNVRPPLAPTASEEASLTEATCSGSVLTNHIVNIGIANNLLANDSNLLESLRDENSVVCNESLREGAVVVESLREGAVAAVELHQSFNNNDTNIMRMNNNREDLQRKQNDAENMAAASERLRFHEKSGVLIKLSNSGRTAERKRPLDEFNNGVVMSNRALKINELFEIRIDRLVDKWSGSIEVGITTHNPNILEFPATMTSMRSGTIMMSGSSILTNGKGTLREYGNFNLDLLKEGDWIGMMIKDGLNLHYYINGQEQGVAASGVPTPVWAVVDLYGMTVKVTIVDRDDRKEQNTRRNISENTNEYLCSAPSNNEEINDVLLFHVNCGTYAQVINRGRTAHRPNAADDFNNGVVLTHRPLHPNEMFEVQLDKLVDKWAGSLEIGVTTHSPSQLEFPSTMTNIRSGTWLMTSNGVTHNGTTVIETYGLNLDRLKISERIGVCRQDDGSLHFYINGLDQGVAATNIPQNVYGVVDLYGQAAQVTVCHPSDPVCSVPPEISNSSCSVIYSDLRFHHLHGRNARIVRGGLVAQRPNANGEFNDAIVMSNRQLHDGEMFEVMIEKMVDRWSGSLEAGVTAISPERIEFPSTMTDIDYETWMLSGSSVMRNGVTVMNNYPCDLDSLGVGTRIGMMRHSDGTLHYYVNGEDQGSACGNIETGLWAVIDLYGQCAQVSIVHSPVHSGHSMLSVSQYLDMSRLSLPIVGQPSFGTEVLHKWSKCCGANVVFSNNQTVATRIRHFNHGLVFSSHSLEAEEVFEVRLEKLNNLYGGGLKIGLTSMPISDNFSSGGIPSSVSGIESHDTWWIDGSSIRRNGNVALQLNYCTNLNRLQIGDKVGVKRSCDGIMKVLINGQDYGLAASNVTKHSVFAVVELFGSAQSVSISSMCRGMTPLLECVASSPIVAIATQESSERINIDVCLRELSENKATSNGGKTNNNSQLNSVLNVQEVNQVSNKPVLFQFHENTGRNIHLSSDRTVANRLESYNQGIVMSSKPLARNSLFQVRIGALQSNWSSSIVIGVTAQSPHKLHLPNSAFDLKKSTWIVCGDSVFFNGSKIKGLYGPNLDKLSACPGGHLIGIMVDDESRLHLYINGVDQGVAAKEIPPKPFCIVDLYGQCQEVVIVNKVEVENKRKNIKNQQQQQALQQSTNNTRSHQPPSVQPPHILHPSPAPLVTTHTPNNQDEQRRTINGSTVKEKSKQNSSQTCSDNLLIKNCEYQNLCSRFKASLSLPDNYFQPDENLCFCETCYKIRGDHSFLMKGNPPKKYSQPFGWCRFALVSAVGENNESWHMAYHGVKPGALRRMLDKGELLILSELGLSARLCNRKNKDDISDGSVLYFSPSITYASSDHFIPTTTTFVDSETQKTTRVKMVLQIAVEPDSYKVGSCSFPYDVSCHEVLPPGSPTAHPHLQNDTIEWVTKERGATQLLALLIKIEET